MFDRYDDNNVFAQIIAGQLPCNKVYEDEKVLAFHDINPVAPVHILVIPKGQYISFDDFIQHSTYVEHFFSVVRQVAFTEGLTDSGYRLVMNHREDSGQIVPHFHVHIISGKKLGGIG